MQTKPDQTSEGNDIVEVNITELNEEVTMHENNMNESMDGTEKTEKPSADAILIRRVLHLLPKHSMTVIFIIKCLFHIVHSSLY